MNGLEAQRPTVHSLAPETPCREGDLLIGMTLAAHPGTRIYPMEVTLTRSTSGGDTRKISLEVDWNENLGRPRWPKGAFLVMPWGSRLMASLSISEGLVMSGTWAWVVGDKVHLEALSKAARRSPWVTEKVFRWGSTQGKTFSCMKTLPQS